MLSTGASARGGLALLWAAALLLLCSTGVRAQGIKGSTQTDQTRLLAQKYAITNWDAYAAANNITGWVDDNSVPVCLWTGVTCSPEGRIEQQVLQCPSPSCTFKATGTVASNSSAIATLKTLNLQQQKLSGTLPPEWGESLQFISLLNLLLQQNQLTGTLPKSWNNAGTFPRVSLMTFHFNNLTGDLPEPELWPELQIFRLQNNRFNGSLPASWAQSLPKLKILSAHNNAISGPFPLAWAASGGFQDLEELYLENNQLTGTLPADKNFVLDLPKLRILDTSNNPFSGVLPPGWGKANTLEKLELLKMQSMGLSGPLPPDWGSDGGLQSLRQLYIDGNELSGTIPQEWVYLPRLEQVYVKPGNAKLCGPLPKGMNFKLCDSTGNSECNVTAALDGPTCPPWNPVSDPLGPNTSSGTNTAAIVGGVVGGVLGGAIIALGVAWGVRWNRRRKQRMSPFIAEAQGNLKPAKEDLSNYNTVLEALEGGADPDLDAQHKSMCGRLLDCLFCARRRDKKFATAPPEEAEPSVRPQPNGAHPNGSDPSASPPLVPGSAGAVTPAMRAGSAGGSTMGGRMASASSGVGTPAPRHSLDPADGGFLYTNDSLLMSGDMAGAAGGLAPIAGSVAGGQLTANDMQSSESARDTLGPLDPGIQSLNDWEIRPEEIEYMKRPDGSDWELGTGGFGKVYKALRNGAQPVAVKVLMTGPDTRYMAVNEFRREVLILKSCRDPNIVAFLGACMHEERSMLVTEYCEGGNLARNIVAGKVNWYRRGRKIALDIAKGLVFLHSRRIVHLDLKSPNILLARDGTAKIADVGLAKIIAQEYSAVTGAVGTLAWSSPEMLLGARCTERSDIYSYGVVLWEITTGQTPVRGQLRDVRVPSECPEELRKLMLDCLEQNPRRRPSAQQLVERLRRIPVSPLEHQAALPPQAQRPDTQAEAAARLRHTPSMSAAHAPDGPSAAAVGVVAPGAPSGISPFAAAAAAASTSPRTASNASEQQGARVASSSAAPSPEPAMDPAGSLPSPFKQDSSVAGTQLQTTYNSSDDLGSTPASSADHSRRGSTALPASAVGRQPSLPAGGSRASSLRPPLPRPGAMAGSRGGSLTPATEESSDTAENPSAASQ